MRKSSRYKFNRISWEEKKVKTSTLKLQAGLNNSFVTYII